MSIQIHYTIADLYDLVSGAENQKEERTATPTAGLLRRFLAEDSRANWSEPLFKDPLSGSPAGAIT